MPKVTAIVSYTEIMLTLATNLSTIIAHVGGSLQGSWQRKQASDERKVSMSPTPGELACMAFAKISVQVGCWKPYAKKKERIARKAPKYGMVEVSSGPEAQDPMLASDKRVRVA